MMHGAREVGHCHSSYEADEQSGVIRCGVGEPRAETIRRLLGRFLDPGGDRSARSSCAASVRRRSQRFTAVIVVTRQICSSAALTGFCLSADHSVRFPDGTALVGRSFQGFIGNVRPQLLQCRRCRLMRVPFSVVRCPRHMKSLIRAFDF
jgi:hypothetical protein